MRTIDRSKLPPLMRREQERFASLTQSPARCSNGRRRRCWAASHELDEEVAGRLPALRRRRLGRHFVDVRLATSTSISAWAIPAAMTGHSPQPPWRRAAQAAAWHHLHAADRGCDLGWGRVGAAIRAARAGNSRSRRPTPTASPSAWRARSPQRPKILVFNWCYHGTVDESFITLTGRARRRPAAETSVRQWIRPSQRRWWSSTTSRRSSVALAPGDVACVLAEPALTNVGIVHPEPGFHEALRDLTRKVRHAADHRRDPYHLCRSRRLHPSRKASNPIFCDRQADRRRYPGRASDSRRRSPSASARRIQTLPTATPAASAEPWRQCIVPGRHEGHAEQCPHRGSFRSHDSCSRSDSPPACRGITESGVPWHVTRLGCRAEYLFCKERPGTAVQAAAAADLNSSATCICSP